MLVPLEEILLKDNLDGTVSVFFRRQFRRKYYILENTPPRLCDHIQAYKNGLNTELHMLCYVTGSEPLTSAATFFRRVKQGRQNIPLVQRSTDFPAYSTYQHLQPHIRVPGSSHNLYNPGDLPEPHYRRNSYYPEPEMVEEYPSTSTLGNSEGPRVRFRDRPPPPVPQPPPMESYVPLRGGAGSFDSRFQEYEYEEQFSHDPRSLRNPVGNGTRGAGQFGWGPRNPRNRNVERERTGFEQLSPRELWHSRSRSRSRNPLKAENGERDGFESPAPRDPRRPRGRSAANRDRGGLFEHPLPSPTPQPQKRMFALVFKKSPADQAVEIRPASIDSSHETLVRQASTYWSLRELKLYGNVDGLKVNLNSQSDLEAYVKLCDGVQRLMVNVE